MPKKTKMKPLSVRIPTPLYQDLQKAAKESGEKNFSEYIRKQLQTPTGKEIVYRDRIVEVPKVVYRDREVPKVVYRDREVPVYKDRIIEKKVKVPKYIFLDRMNPMLKAYLLGKHGMNPMLRAYLENLGKND